MKTTTEIINRLNKFEMNCTLDTFINLYGQRLGSHLFDKYVWKYHHSVVNLFKLLDIENQVILTNYIDNL